MNKSLKSFFEEYLAAVYTEQLSANQRLEIKRAFFGGCAVVVGKILTGEPVVKLHAEIDKACRELVFPEVNPNN